MDVNASLAMVADALKKVMHKFNETLNKLDSMDKRITAIETTLSSGVMAAQQKRVDDLEHRMEYAETLVLADEDMFDSEKIVAAEIRSGVYRPFHHRA